MKNRISRLEQQINSLEQEKQSFEERLAAPNIYDPSNKQELTELLQQQAETLKNLEQLEQEWMLLLEQLELIENQ